MATNSDGTVGFVYFLGIVGAAVYYISAAANFRMVVWGTAKAFFWPGFLVYELLKYLNA